MMSQFISGFILFLITGGVFFYFDNTKISNLINQKFSKESKSKSLFGALVINILIIAYVSFFIKTWIDGN